MPFRVAQAEVWGGATSVKIFDAAADDVEILVTTNGSVWLAGEAVEGPNLGLYLGADERWCRFAVVAGDELWAFASKDVTVTAMIRSETA